MNFAASRHSAYRSVLGTWERNAALRWDVEPIVVGHRRLTTKHLIQETMVAVPISASVASVPAVGVIVASDDGWIRLWSQSLEKIYWERRVDSSVYASLIVDHANECVIVVSTRGLACSFTLRGELVWAQQLERAVFATPVIDSFRNVVHIATFGSRCVGLDVETGAEVYRVDTPQPWFESFGLAGHRDIYASPVVSPASVLVLAAGEHVVGITDEGRIAWSVDLDVSIKASPVLVRDGQLAVICGVDGSCALVDTKDVTIQVSGRARLGVG